MYEENAKPLPNGDALSVFAQQFAGFSDEQSIQPVTPDSVVRLEADGNQPCFAAICRRLLLPGSQIKGLGNLRELIALAQQGKSCLLCLNHRSNLDVPTLYTLLEDQADPSLFHRIIWIAGRKLEEDQGLTSALVKCFNRVIVSPKSWFASRHDDSELHQARLINIAAERAVARLRHEGWVFALFPSGTRIRPSDPSTRQALEQTLSYLRLFEHMVLCNIDGCTMPVSMDHDFIHEQPRLDRMVYTFGPLLITKEWCAEAQTRFPDLDRRIASARAITADIDALSPAADQSEGVS
jgi:glycerol-3-phosphate O-acyltransferase